MQRKPHLKMACDLATNEEDEKDHRRPEDLLSHRHLMAGNAPWEPKAQPREYVAVPWTSGPPPRAKPP
jgi:hypothetical protein